MLDGLRGASVETYFFESFVKNSCYAAETSKLVCVDFEKIWPDGSLVIGYPIIVDGWTHDYRVWLQGRCCDDNYFHRDHIFCHLVAIHTIPTVLNDG